MPFVPVPNSALIEVRYLANSQQVENTLWFEQESTPVPADLSALVGAVFGWYSSEIKPLQAADVQMREIFCTSMHSDDGPIFSFAPGIGEFGTATGPVQPNNVTLSVSFRTAQRGRSFRGRNYAIGLVEPDTLGNQVTGPVVTAWQAAYFELIALAAAAGWTWIVASRFSGVDGTGAPIPRLTGVTSPITSVIVVDNNVDSQRRRLTGRGN